MQLKSKYVKVQIYEPTKPRYIERLKIITDKDKGIRIAEIKFTKDTSSQTISNIMGEATKLGIKAEYKPYTEEYNFTPPRGLRMLIGSLGHDIFRIIGIVLPSAVSCTIHKIIGFLANKKGGNFFVLRPIVYFFSKPYIEFKKTAFSNPIPISEQGKLYLRGSPTKISFFIKHICPKYRTTSINTNSKLRAKPKSFLVHYLYTANTPAKKAKIIASIVKVGGLLSRELRKDLRIGSNGIGGLDNYAGGSSMVFFYLSKSLEVGDLVFSNKLLTKEGTIIHEGDEWGNTVTDRAHRVPLSEVDKVFVGEVLIKDIAPLSYLVAINVKSEKERKELIKQLKKLGVDKLNGKPVEEMIKVVKAYTYKRYALRTMIHIYSYIIEPLPIAKHLSRPLRKIYDLLLSI